MPVTRSRNGLYDINIDQTNTTRFLFGDDEPNALHRGTTPDVNFPTLVRREDQMSLSAISLSSPQASDVGSIGSRPASLRQSLDLKYIAENGIETPNVLSPQGSHMMATPPKLQSSYSTNDVPTVKSPTGSSGLNGNANNHAQQHFHNHNASIGRIPAGAMPTRHNRELSSDNTMGANREQASTYQSLQSALQASAAPFGPSTNAVAPMGSGAVTSPTGANPANSFNGFYPGNGYTSTPATSGPGPYNMPLLTAGMQQMSVNNVNNANNGSMYPPQNYTGYGSLPYGQANNQPRDSQARVMQHRRQLDNEAMSRYQNMPLESFRGQIYELCKDQHGCRYLQKKLEERNADQVHLIWLETNQHVMELMTDPFGNYLCQKLLEFCNDDERTVLIQNASHDMVRIALNQHGTRALQKMIEYVSTPQQVHLIIEALRFRVVELIKDLNGNHVIQKCLNKLTAVDAQFIFDAVGKNCIEVGTHRHGCCVLQRCIDHASGDQKLWLIQRITEHARILVQDPFGNYVVQYIIDLNEPTFTEPVVETFRGCISQLSRHKFSSNVIEKCLRCARSPSRDLIVEEMLGPQEMERLLRDSFANYVIQTALEYATPHMKYRLVESIRPILPQIRTTPYGRRIQAKVSAYDNRGSAASSGQATPADNTQGQIPLRPSGSRPGTSGMSQGNAVTNGGGPMTPGGTPNGRQNGQSYPSSSVLTVPAPSAPGVAQQPQPQQQPQFNQRTPNFTPPRQSAHNPSDNGEGQWV